MAYLQLGRYDDAEGEFTYLIEFLEGRLEDDDHTGRGVLFSAYANRGTIKDRQGRYQIAEPAEDLDHATGRRPRAQGPAVG